ncbi:MAG: hydrogenase expression protein [Chloroflexi bacterium]|nr:hydrogenase expression protein [Chloroflexota bacterium]
MPLPLGKLPPDLLARMLGRIPAGDARVVVGSRPGVDAAVLDMGESYLIATSDPITFVGERIGWYAVHVNANDVAVMGGTLRWMLATVLLPASADTALVERLHDEMLAACAELGVTLIGGHTEVTHGLDRVIVSGTMLGEATKDRLVIPRSQPGDNIIITKGIAIEGTAALAAESEAALRERGVPADLLGRARALLTHPGISVVKDARVLCDAVRPHAMHDATEGGLATALRELAQGPGVGLHIDEARIPILPETRAICEALDLDPLGLLASGCLIAAVAPEDEPRAVAALVEAGIAATVIGTIASEGDGFTMLREGQATVLPSFERDELARFLDA